jgi:predicted transcriptional regulator of viral defense system
MISYLEFRERLLPEGCFSIYQAMAFFPSLDRNNLTRWSHKNLLIKLRQGWYAFPETLQRPDFSRYIAGRIYRPSYISTQMALSIYGMIPEAVTSITSVSTLKTARFENRFGQYTYQNVKPSMFFAYRPVELPAATSALNAPKQTWMIAEPEKALLDFLYLYPFYDSESELEQLRLDEAYMEDELDVRKLSEYQARIGCKSLDRRIKKLLKIYDL